MKKSWLRHCGRGSVSIFIPPFSLISIFLFHLLQVWWKFTDLTHGSDLTVKVIDILPSNISGRLHRVQLVNQSKRAGQPFEGGNIITTMAQPSTKPLVTTKIIFHFKFLKKTGFDVSFPEQYVHAVCIYNVLAQVWTCVQWEEQFFSLCI